MSTAEIRDALRVILSHADTSVEAGLGDLAPYERQRLLRLLKAS